mmetsp:Transcript_46846/g.106247  ORF Transcript_46846/g.106247 Transcript_46846/m.106247 type:complete len:202 (+) Transcript_46846:268-873(+)
MQLFAPSQAQGVVVDALQGFVSVRSSPLFPGLPASVSVDEVPKQLTPTLEDTLRGHLLVAVLSPRRDAVDLAVSTLRAELTALSVSALVRIGAAPVLVALMLPAAVLPCPCKSEALLRGVAEILVEVVEGGAHLGEVVEACLCGLLHTHHSGVREVLARCVKACAADGDAAHKIRGYAGAVRRWLREQPSDHVAALVRSVL